MWPIQADVPFGMCEQLFNLKPAVEPVLDRMILAVGTEHRRYFSLTRLGVERPSFVLSDCAGERVVTIGREGVTVNSGLDDLEVDQFASWALNGIPVPRHGSVFGEVRGLREKRVVSLLTFTSTRPAQKLSAEMEIFIDAELADVSPGNRPITYLWTQMMSDFWVAWRTGIIVDLAEHFRQRRETVWRITTSRTAVRVFAVNRDITVGNVTLPRGRFASAGALRAHTPVSPLRRLLAYQRKVDQFNAFVSAS